MSTEQQTACLMTSQQHQGTGAPSWPGLLPAKAFPGPRVLKASSGLIPCCPAQRSAASPPFTALPNPLSHTQVPTKR